MIQQKQKRQTLLGIICISAGAGLALYPWISNTLMESAASSVISVYSEQVADLAGEDISGQLALAAAYNKELLESKVTLTDPFLETTSQTSLTTYFDILSFTDDGMMGYLEIPCISVYLPIYHGTSEEVLAVGAGHLEGTSFPIGGINTHAVISGHTGLRSAKLFTDLIEMEEGDLFFIHIAGETLAYEVVAISIVLPEDTASLTIQEGRDLVTLLTCTPYGVNSHRLLVTGERTEYEETTTGEQKEGSASSQWRTIYRRALRMAVPLLLISLSVLSIHRTLKKRLSGREKNPHST